MPRRSKRAQALQDIDDAIETLAFLYALESSSEEEDDLEDDIEDLLEMREAIASQRYLQRNTSAGRHEGDNLQAYVYESSDEEFLALFRMHRASFWKLVPLLTDAGGEGYWDKRKIIRGYCRPAYQQIAVGLYVLGGGGTTSKTRNMLNIGHGTVSEYTWRTIELLASLMSEHVRWPIQGQGQSNHEVFRGCIGFLDGSNVVLRNKPIVDPEEYISREKTYGFNLQAICGWEGQFTWISMGHTASVHDSTAFKSTILYQQLHTLFGPEEYVLADRAYSLEKHVITPYKEAASRIPANADFNLELSGPRARIEHAFGVLKARWPTLHGIPVRIGKDKEKGHQRVINWTIACVVLHNLLNHMQDDNNWLGTEIENNAAQERSAGGNIENIEREGNTEAKRAGISRRDELRDLVIRLNHH